MVRDWCCLAGKHGIPVSDQGGWISAEARSSVLSTPQHRAEPLPVSTLDTGTCEFEAEHSPLPRSFTKTHPNKEVTAR